jgi:acetyltransferase-like isoleucine patch superfamily enzyme
VKVREHAKAAIRQLAWIAVTPAVCSFYLRSLLIGRDRSLEASTQALGLLPGLVGQYLRRAFLARTLAYCDPTATIEFGTLFSATDTRIEARVYIGPRCHIGLAHFEPDVLVAPAVHVPSGRLTHGVSDPSLPARDQQGQVELVRIGAGSWIGSGAIVMANVGANSVVGAGAVVTRSLPRGVVAGGVPARILRWREAADGGRTGGGRTGGGRAATPST